MRDRREYEMKVTRWFFLGLLAASVGLAWAQADAKPLVKHTFKQSIEGWMGIGPTAKVGITHDEAIVAPTAGALKFDYGINKGEFNALLLPTPVGSLKNAKSIKFRVRTDSTTLMAVALQEQDGGRYVALFTAPKDNWQTVELSTADFGLSQDKGDPKDPDVKLDMDQVGAMIVGDVSQFFVQADNPALASMLDVRKGSHQFFVDDFTVGTDSVLSSTTSAWAAA